jgi:hypothetical protein
LQEPPEQYELQPTLQETREHVDERLGLNQGSVKDPQLVQPTHGKEV